MLFDTVTISGLDPAKDKYEGASTSRRLNSGDATFVDVIHTDKSGQYLYISLTLCLSVYLCVSLCLSVCLSLSICLSIFIYLSVS